MLLYANLNRMRSAHNLRCVAARRKFMMDLSTGSVPLGPSTARTPRHVVLLVKAWLQQLFNAAEVSLCVHKKNKSVVRYIIGQDGSWVAQKLGKKALSQYAPSNAGLFVPAPLEYECRAKPGYGPVVAECFGTAKMSFYTEASTHGYNEDADCPIPP